MNQAARPEPQRLAKRLARQLPCSRSEAEAYIAGGWVRVDGEVVEEPMARVHDSQAVALDPKARPESLAPITLIWHKPPRHPVPDASPMPDDWAASVFSAATRFKGDRSGVRPLKVHCRKLWHAAPLETRDSGLMVLTQNPAVARRISDASSQIEQEWQVRLRAEAGLESDVERREAIIHSLEKTLFFDGWALPNAKASWQSELRLRLAIKGAVPGQVAHLCKRAGVQATAMHRLRLGRVGLAGLPEGDWRYLLGYERF
ncbi:MAG: RNA pseudouridine synthase [Burkholderiaceae bacterium]